jgi:hypothetical protein
MAWLMTWVLTDPLECFRQNPSAQIEEKESHLDYFRQNPSAQIEEKESHLDYFRQNPSA